MSNDNSHARATTAHPQGFTLLELLVAISIISILAALLLPVFSRSKSKAHAATCKNRLRQMGLALGMYVHDHGGQYPFILSCPDAARGDPSHATWYAKLQPYYPLKWSDRTYHCPGYNGSIAVVTNPVRGPDTFGSYAYNWRGVRGYQRGVRGEANLGLGRVLYGAVKPGVDTAVSEAQIQVPSQMFSIGESRQKGPVGDPNCVDGMFCGYLDANGFPARHGRNYNQSFCDGHVEAINAWLLFNPTNSAAMWNNDHQAHEELWGP